MEAIYRIMADIRRISNGLQIMIGFGRITAPVVDSGLVRTVQVAFGPGQIKDAAPYVQHYGFASNPPVGADIVYGCVNGNRSVLAVIASNHQNYEIKNIGNGTVALYDMFGNTVVLSSTGISLTDFSGNSVNMSAAGIKVHGATVYQWDVHGYGQRITWTGGSNWTVDNYMTGATVTTNNHSIAPPGPP